MKNEEILRKAFERVVDGGWTYFGMKPDGVRSLSNRGLVDLCEGHDGGNASTTAHPNEIIFNKDFAKAFWEDDYWCGKCNTQVKQEDYEEHFDSKLMLSDPDWYLCGVCKKNGGSPDIKLIWQHHLQIMVLEEDPIKYLEKFL